LRRLCRLAGFSLIEVTLAIAIIAFAFIAFRVYMARAMIEAQNVPKTAKAVYDEAKVAVKAVVIVGKVNDTLKNYVMSLSNAESLEKSPPSPHRVRVIPLVITKTDGQ
jgi:prepilin-type N-terminal cleavage/methylation domain-containing protein